MTTKMHLQDDVRARDIMQNSVFKLEPTTSIEDAVTSFAELHISGAPVADPNGRLVGMLSAFDIAQPENIQANSFTAGRSAYAIEEEYADDDVTYDLDSASDMKNGPDALRTGTVADYMTPEVISIAPQATLREVCALMVREHIHRVPVLEHGKLVGIISTLDVVRCVAEAK